MGTTRVSSTARPSLSTTLLSLTRMFLSSTTTTIIRRFTLLLLTTLRLMLHTPPSTTTTTTMLTLPPITTSITTHTQLLTTSLRLTGMSPMLPTKMRRPVTVTSTTSTAAALASSSDHKSELFLIRFRHASTINSKHQNCSISTDDILHTARMLFKHIRFAITEELISNLLILFVCVDFFSLDIIKNLLYLSAALSHYPQIYFN